MGCLVEVNIGTLLFRLEGGGPLYFNYNKEPQISKVIISAPVLGVGGRPENGAGLRPVLLELAAPEPPPVLGPTASRH